MLSAFVLLAALFLEWRLADPANRWHPVAWFGRWSMRCEQWLYVDQQGRGMLAWLLAITPCFALICLLHDYLGCFADVILLWLSIGWHSLFQHVRAVLEADDLPTARAMVARIVSRDTHAMRQEDAHRAALESLAENASDAVIAPLFWFVLLGAPAAALYRMINTLDAMWGYRCAHYCRFGWLAAKVDDLVNYGPARLTAACILLSGQSSCWHHVAKQAKTHASPNAGWPEAALAHASRIRLGGSVMRRGRLDDRPDYGNADAENITIESRRRAFFCVSRALLLACVIFFIVLIANDW